MIAIILAAGYATRMFPLTENFPKPLLKIKDKPIIEYMMDNLSEVKEISKVVIVTNQKYFKHFEEWTNNYPSKIPITLINDGTTSNDHRLGAIKDIQLVLNTENYEGDFMVLAADNLFSFKLKNFVEHFNKINESLIYIYHEPRVEKLRKTGVAEVRNNRLITFEEKPENPKSSFAVPPFYIYKEEVIPLINEYIKLGLPSDSPGSLLSYLVNKIRIGTYPMDGKRLDIGDLETYLLVKDIYPF